MIQPLARNRFEFVIIIAVGVCALLAALPLFTGDLHPDRTLVAPSLSGKEARTALQSLTPGELQRLISRESQRLTDEPLDISSLANLALLQDLAGNNKAARDLSLEASRRTMRSSVTQIGAINIYLEKADFDNALYQIDGLLSSHPELGDQLFPVLYNLASNARAMGGLVHTLQREPAWRPAFIRWLTAQDTEGSTTFALFDAIKKAGGNVEDDELLYLLEQQVRQKAYDNAYLFWLDSLSVSELLKVKNLFDGQFVFQPKNQFFSWNIVPMPNADIAVAPRKAGNGRELQLVFISNTQAFNNVYQFLHLQPGSYKMMGKWSSTRLDTPVGLHWTVVCLDSTAIAGNSESFAKPAQEKDFFFSIGIPPSACDFQVLRLTNASPAKLDAKIEGNMQFHDLGIVRSDEP